MNGNSYGIEISDAGSNLSAFVPDLPGVAVTGRTIEEVKARMEVAIQWHLEGMAEDGVTPPEPRMDKDYDAYIATQPVVGPWTQHPNYAAHSQSLLFKQPFFVGPDANLVPTSLNDARARELELA